MEQEPTFVGIDVAKARVDIAVRPSGDVWSCPENTRPKTSRPFTGNFMTPTVSANVPDGDTVMMSPTNGDAGRHRRRGRRFRFPSPMLSP